MALQAPATYHIHDICQDLGSAVWLLLYTVLQHTLQVTEDGLRVRTILLLFRSCLHTASGYDTVFGPRTLWWLSPCDGTQGLQPHLSIPPQDARPETDPRARRLGPFDVPEHPDAVQPGSYFSRLARERRHLAIYTGPPLRYGWPLTERRET